MNCHDARDRLTEGRRTAALDRHLERCEDCRAFGREIRGIGRDVSEAYLAEPPSAGFEERVAARLREREISVRPRLRSRFVLAFSPAVLFAVIFLVWRLSVGVEPPPPSEADQKVAVVTTDPVTENLLYLSLARPSSEGATLLLLSFAGEEREVELRGDVEGEVFRSYALGARTADVTIGRRIPGNEIKVLIDVLENAGFAYRLTRVK
jgi:hypothetical protein